MAVRTFSGRGWRAVVATSIAALAVAVPVSAASAATPDASAAQSRRGARARARGSKRSLELPRAEDAEHYIVTGIDWDLDRAMKISVDQMLVAREGLTPAKAYSMASLAGDFQVAEVVDRTQIVTGKSDKALFDR